MTYLELMEMREKYCGNADMTFCGICVFYVIAMVMLFFGVAFNSVFACELAVVMFFVTLGITVPVILCRLRIKLYLTDEMKEAKMKEEGTRD